MLVGILVVLKDALIASFKITMRRVHIVQLRFKLQTQLDFFLMVLSILRIIFLQFESHLLLVHHLTLELLAHLLLSVKVLLEDLLVVGLLLRLLLVISIQLLQLSLVFL